MKHAVITVAEATGITIAEQVMVSTPAGWAVQHGLRTAKVGEVLMRPATEEEIVHKAEIERYAQVAAETEAAYAAMKAQRKAERELTKETNRRNEANREASKQLGHPAKASAEVFMAAFDEAIDVARKAKNEKKLKAEKKAKSVEEVAISNDGDNASYAEIARLGNTLREMKHRISILERGRDDVIRQMAELCAPTEHDVWLLQTRAASWDERLGKAKAKYRRIKAVLKYIAENGDIAKATLAKGELAKKHDFEEKPSFSANTHKQTYQVRVVPELTIPGKLGSELKKLGKSQSRQEAMGHLAECLRLAEKAKGKRITINGGACIRRPLSESELAEEFGIEFGRLNDQLMLIEHDMYNVVFKVYMKLFSDMPEIKADFERLHELVVGIIVNNGAELAYKEDGELKRLEYVVLLANSSQLKKGTVLAARKDAYEAALPFLTLGQGLEAATSTSGQEIYKAFSVDATPSTVINIGNSEMPRYITPDDVIMMPTMTVRIHVGKHIYVGDGETMTVMMPIGRGQKKAVQVPVSIKQEGEWVIIDAFDGMLLCRIAGFQPKQIRGFGLKGLMISDRAAAVPMIGFDNLIDALIAEREDLADLRGKPIIVKGIDGEDREFTEGMVITTLTCWKKKTFFSGEAKAWKKLQENVKKLRKMTTWGDKLVSTFGCLREASAAETEWDDDRHTSRQMLQQLFRLDDTDITEMVKSTIGRAKEWKQFDGALRKLAGYSKNKTSAFERAIRLCPEIAAERHAREYAISKFADAIADAGSLRLDCEAVNAFLSTDPTAFVLAIIRYMRTGELDMTGIEGVVKHGHIFIPDIQDKMEVLTLRYPANHNSMTPVTTETKSAHLLRFCGRACFIAFDDKMLIIHDADVDGDHIYVITDERIIAAFKKAQPLMHALGLDLPVVFNHEGKEKRKPYDEAFVKKGMVDAIVNGQRFNFVGRFSKAASRFAAMASNSVEAWRSSNDEELIDAFKTQAVQFGCIQTLMSVGAILCIDWAKKGVPEVGSEGYKIFMACMELLDWAPQPCHGINPWQQAFVDDSIQARFWDLTKGVEKDGMYGTYFKYAYGRPDRSVCNRVAMEVCAQADIDVDSQGEILMNSVTFDDEGVHFDPSMIGWTKPIGSIGNVIVDSKLFAYVRDDIFELKEDKETLASIQSGDAVSFRSLVRMLYHAAARLENRLADCVEDAKENEWANDIKSRARVAFRNVVLQAKLGFDGAAKDLYNRKVDEVLNMAFEFNMDNNVSTRNDSQMAKAAKKARFWKWIMDVFGEDLLYRLEEIHNIPSKERTANIKLCKFSRKEELMEVMMGGDPEISEEEIASIQANRPELAGFTF